MAVWVRFPELPIEFYDKSVLMEIGKAIGLVLRIDSYTASSSRGSYARLCIQIDLKKPLINTIKVGRLFKKVMYEGLSALCFCCGRVGHKQEVCGYHVQPEKNTSSPKSPSMQSEKKTPQKPDQKFGEWMLVTRKKRPVKNERVNAPNQTNQSSLLNAKGAKGIFGIPKTSLTTFKPDRWDG